MKKSFVDFECFKNFEILGKFSLPYPKISDLKKYISESIKRYPDLDMIRVDGGRLAFIYIEKNIIILKSDVKNFGNYNDFDIIFNKEKDKKDDKSK